MASGHEDCCVAACNLLKVGPMASMACVCALCVYVCVCARALCVCVRARSVCVYCILGNTGRGA